MRPQFPLQHSEYDLYFYIAHHSDHAKLTGMYIGVYRSTSIHASDIFTRLRHHQVHWPITAQDSRNIVACFWIESYFVKHCCATRLLRNISVHTRNFCCATLFLVCSRLKTAKQQKYHIRARLLVMDIPECLSSSSVYGPQQCLLWQWRVATLWNLVHWDHNRRSSSSSSNELILRHSSQ